MLEPAWDVFISHASEDKERIVLPLVALLEAQGVRVWLDKNEFHLGDSIIAKMNTGLSSSRFGVVILSPAFLAKDWTNRELNGLISLEAVTGTHRILPVLHELKHGDLTRAMPLIADRFAISTVRGLAHVAHEILKAISKTGDHAPPPPDAALDQPTSLLVTRVGGYRLVTFIGRGGSGVVFGATRSDDGTAPPSIAIKICPPIPMEDHLLQAIFERAFLAMKALRHPNIVSLLDRGNVTLDGLSHPFVAMEYVKGLHLDAWSLQRKGDGDALKQRIAVARKLVDALRHAHSTTFVDELGFAHRGVLHGDLKPANVLVDARGEPKLLDFLMLDLTRLESKRLTEPYPLTAEMGTPGFMAPEQELCGIMTEESDVYGLGATLAHLFAPGEEVPLYAVLRDTTLPDQIGKLLWAMCNVPGSRPGLDNVARTLAGVASEGDPG